MVVTTLRYLDRLPLYQKEKPYVIYFPVEGRIDGAKQTNVQSREYRNVRVGDARADEGVYGLDTTGFELVPYTTGFEYSQFSDFEQIQAGYFAEVQAFLVARLGATWAEAFDCDIRRRHADYPQIQYSENCQPVQAVHADYSPSFALKKASVLMRRRRETRKGRIQELTLWRPLKGPVRDWPLALCDYRSVDRSKDPTEIDLVFPTQQAEGLQFYHNSEHQWHFASDMSDSEAWIIKIFDSDAAERGFAEYCPHTAFQLDDASQPQGSRESIEVRVIVFTADEG